MKKTIAALLCAAVTMTTLCACSTNNAADSQKKQYNVGIVQITEHPSLNTIRESFLEEMEKLGYTEENTSFDYRSAQNEPSNLNPICQKFVGDEKDLIVAIATPSAQSAAAATKDIPVLFSAVTDPVYSKLLTNPQAPEGNVTGTSDDIPVEKTFELAKTLTPDAKTFGFLYNAGESNSVSVIEKAKSYCEENNIEYVEATVTNTSEVQQAVQSLAGRVDAIYTPIDNTIASAMAVVSKTAVENKIPVYTGADSLVADGGLATVGIEYTSLGRETAKMADKILKGEEISTIPVKTMSEFATIINETTAKSLGIEIPEELLSNAQLIK